MIITIAGGVGAGKTISAVRQAYIESQDNLIITNFKLKGIKNYYRLKKGDIIIDKTPEENKKKVSAKRELEVNWDFWEKHKNCDIFLDEVHSLFNSRTAMSLENRMYSSWIAQVRKLWGASGDQMFLDQLKLMNNIAFNKYHRRFYSKSNNIFLITQKPRKLDVNFRELCHVHIQCRKVIRGDDVIIIQEHYIGDDTQSGIEMMELGQEPKLSVFKANPYFGMYDSYEIVKGEYL